MWTGRLRFTVPPPILNTRAEPTERRLPSRRSDPRHANRPRPRAPELAGAQAAHRPRRRRARVRGHRRARVRAVHGPPSGACFGRKAGVARLAHLACAFRVKAESTMWKRCGSDNRSRAQQPDAIHRSPSGLSDRRQQTAVAARALQAGGRPFEPGTAHSQTPLSKRTAASTPDHCCLSRIATVAPGRWLKAPFMGIQHSGGMARGFRSSSKAEVDDLAPLGRPNLHGRVIFSGRDRGARPSHACMARGRAPCRQLLRRHSSRRASTPTPRSG
jgi:hypothetical protein